ncbi:Hypothetical predicted protein [Lecanosticta acicola]|uniref:Uncharacterized protein n=1 Tax=Lecanosticta acicola TaxID=111012 RepID=A0AAI9EAQ5_9PEZI|nr:Hypothetical predicted protein [Lecanosticta acicola]
MPSSQLWAPQPKREQSSVRTWLSLSPISSAIPSPAVEPATGSPSELKDELVLLPAESKFLSNQSRHSSMSSTASTGFRHPSLGQRVGAHCDIERREVFLARTGGVATAFGSNN